ncbi:hypothetical protein OIU77_020908 [Salix suchowensis]|uniref:Uncharacterized protein n=1 Tax=Salix suchowensis TaxID=1278906 RepID=A0ABQ9CBD1_9ROSI|nr:hypothetical protein OIU77_020908 [Salix suchowensis]
MSYLSLLGNEQLPFNSSNAATCVDTCNQALHGSDKWVFGVSSVNEKSLPAAIWWIICQNIDIWSPHASKKKLKMFIKHVILTSLPSMTKGCTQVERHLTNEAHFLDRISVHQISAELLADSVLYEHKFVRRHLASRFCNLLEKSILPLFGDVKLNMSPRWKEGLSALENTLSKVCLGFSAGCQKDVLIQKSFSLYVTCTLNLERLVIDHLLECGDPFFSHKQNELLRLLVACRRALKCSIMAYCEEKVRTTQSALIPVLSEDVHSVLWLSRSLSVVLRLQRHCQKIIDCEAADMIFSLMDHTSYVFLTLSKYQCPSAVSIIAEKPEQLNSDVTQEQSSVNESVSCLDTTNDIESWKSVLLIAESLKEQAQDLIISLKDALLHGFMWGLASALDHSNATDRDYKAEAVEMEM